MVELDGHPVTAEELAGLALYNYGHFTSMRVEDGRVRGLSLHLQRLVNDCRTLFDTDLDPEAVRRLVRRARGDGPQVVRVTVFAPDLDLGRPGNDLEPRILVTTRAAAAHLPPAMRLRSATYRRELPAVKHGGLFGTVWQRRRAQREGFDDVLFVDERSQILEGASWNVGFHDGTRLVWPEADQLSGVTMELVKSLVVAESTTAELDLASAASLPVAFVTNAAVGVRPVRTIDQTRYDAQAGILRELSQGYLALPGEEL